MASVKTRVALAGGKYLVTHPRGRITRLVVRLAVRRLSKKAVAVTHYDALPEVRGSRVTTLAGIAAVAGGIVLVVRRTTRAPAAAPSVVVPPPNAPFPAAAGGSAPPETRDAPPTNPTTSPAAEAAAVAVGDGDGDDDDDAIVARVQRELFGGTPPLGVTVEASSGVVTLRGTVADEEAEGRFVRDAELVDGVKAVQSELQTAGAEPGAPS